MLLEAVSIISFGDGKFLNCHWKKCFKPAFFLLACRGQLNLQKHIQMSMIKWLLALFVFDLSKDFPDEFQAWIASLNPKRHNV